MRTAGRKRCATGVFFQKSLDFFRLYATMNQFPIYFLSIFNVQQSAFCQPPLILGYRVYWRRDFARVLLRGQVYHYGEHRNRLVPVGRIPFRRKQEPKGTCPFCHHLFRCGRHGLLMIAALFGQPDEVSANNPGLILCVVVHFPCQAPSKRHRPEKVALIRVNR